MRARAEFRVVVQRSLRDKSAIHEDGIVLRHAEPDMVKTVAYLLAQTVALHFYEMWGAPLPVGCPALPGCPPEPPLPFMACLAICSPVLESELHPNKKCSCQEACARHEAAECIALRVTSTFVES